MKQSLAEAYRPLERERTIAPLGIAAGKGSARHDHRGVEAQKVRSEFQDPHERRNGSLSAIAGKSRHELESHGDSFTLETGDGFLDIRGAMSTFGLFENRIIH